MTRTFQPPPLNPENEAFWKACGERRLMLPVCLDCRETHWYPRALCPFCFSSQLAQEAASGRGTVYSFSVVPGAQGFTMAYVTLAEGPTMLTNLVGDGLDGVRVGDEVVLDFVQATDGTGIPVFRRPAS